MFAHASMRPRLIAVDDAEQLDHTPTVVELQ